MLKTVIFTKLSVRETEAIIRKVPLVRSPKQVVVLIFMFLYFFLLSTLPAMQYQRFISLFDTFSHLTNFKNAFSEELLYHKDSNMFRPLSLLRGVSTWLGEQIRIPLVV